MGIRIALGADPQQLIHMVMREMLATVTVGLAIGIGLATGRVDCFGEGVVVRVAATADRQRDAGVGQPLGVAHRQVRAVDGLLKRIDRDDVDEAPPRRDVGEVRDP